MPRADKPTVENQAQDAEKFKAVVKRLLDTPPMHKQTKAKPKIKKDQK